MEKYKLLILDTLPNWRNMFEEYLSEKYDIQTASNIEEAKTFIQKKGSFDLVIVGLGSLNALHEEDSIGLDFLNFIENKNIGIPKIIIDNDSDNAETLTKGISRNELIEAVENYIKKHKEAILVRHLTGEQIVEFIKNSLIDAINKQLKEASYSKNEQTETLLQNRKIESEEIPSKIKHILTSQNDTQKSLVVDATSANFIDTGKRGYTTLG